MQAVLVIKDLPEGGLDASAAFHARYLVEARALLGQEETSALVIVLPLAGPEHTDWRRTIARDLARAHTPKRVNVIASDHRATIDAMLAYLEDAPGVTGHYLAGHD